MGKAMGDMNPEVLAYLHPNERERLDKAIAQLLRNRRVVRQYYMLGKQRKRNYDRKVNGGK